MILAKAADESRWAEWTDTQKSAWEARHDEPFGDNDLVPQARVAGAVPNFDTGYYELSGLTDITETQMRAILVYGNRSLGWGAFAVGGDTNRRIRTNIAPGGTYTTQADAQYLCAGQRELEVFVLRKNELEASVYVTEFKSIYMAFQSCPSLRRIVGKMKLSGFSQSDCVFEGCPKLEDMQITGLSRNCYLGNLPKLSLESVKFAVTWRSGTNAITLTLHPDVYAKLTDPDNAMGVEIMALAESKAVTIATTD